VKGFETTIMKALRGARRAQINVPGYFMNVRVVPNTSARDLLRALHYLRYPVEANANVTSSIFSDCRQERSILSNVVFARQE
jgi:hypothetical protein